MTENNVSNFQFLIVGAGRSGTRFDAEHTCVPYIQEELKHMGYL
jgi:hypothetical protein